MRGEGEYLHCVARDVPLVGDHLGRFDLVHLLVAVTGEPARRGVERAVEAIFLARDHGRHDGDLVHRLAAAGHHQVLSAAHHALRREMHRLLRGAALPVNGHAGHFLGHAGHQPGGAADIAGLAADRLGAAPHHVLDRRGVDAGARHQRLDRVGGEVGRVHGSESALLAANRGADSVDDVSFSHCLSFKNP